MRILIIEDEKNLADALEYILKKQNYIIDISNDGISGQEMAETGVYDVIILDRMLPRKNGIEVLKYLRENKILTPVIFLTAKDTIANKIEGLDAGADDYLIKPFSKEELLARIRALGRRSKEILQVNKLSLGLLNLDMQDCDVTYLNLKAKLTLKEAQLLEFLIRNKNQVLSKEQILDRVWGFDKCIELNNVELYVFYLRKKIDFSKCNLVLSTVRGVGYCLREK